MSTIGADTAKKLAGLQKDMLEKYRQDQITLQHIEAFNLLAPAARNCLMDVVRRTKVIIEPPKPPPPPKGQLILVQMLGHLKVPDSYTHATRITDFKKVFTSRGKAPGGRYPSDLTDSKHSKVTTKARPGDVFDVLAFTSSSPELHMMECAEKLKERRGNVFLGAQGASLVLELKTQELIRRNMYISLDEASALPYCEGHFCGHGVSYIRNDGDYEWNFDVIQPCKLQQMEFVLAFEYLGNWLGRD